MLEENENLPVEAKAKKKLFFSHPVFRVGEYLAVRVLTIAVTIFVGIFITVLIANRGGLVGASVAQYIDNGEFVDASIAQDINNQVKDAFNVGPYSNISPEDPRFPIAEKLRKELYHESGLDLPLFQRDLLWTFKALTFQWGEVLNHTSLNLRAVNFLNGNSDTFDVTRIILDHFPNTLLLITSADLIVFLIGIPLALFLSRKYGKWQDKIMVALSPISSIPAWVHGIFLVIIFAVQLQWLPPGNMFDPFPPATKWGYILIVLKHMLLPVTAIVLSMFFQYVYTWRTFFLIYAGEDYVDLARAKGLSGKVIEKRYILRPTLPYVVTSFALSLLGFWQMTTALEYFFRWPGIGLLYVDALGVNVTEVRTIDALLIIGVVVIFAYLMGLTILLLDIIYAALDPRVRLGTGEQKLKAAIARPRKAFSHWFRREVLPVPKRVWTAQAESSEKERAAGIPADRPRGRKARSRSLVLTIREILRYPSAIIGATLIVFLVGTAVYAIISIPPSQVTALWYPQPTGYQTRPQNAQPIWVNWFRRDKLPQTINITSQDKAVEKTVVEAADHKNVTFMFTINYPYHELPEEVYVYFFPHYKSKQPFVTLTWITPDGREFNLGNMAISTGSTYMLTRDIPQNYFLPGIHRTTLYTSNQGGFPITCTVFFDPAAEEPCTPLPGMYTLRINGTTFEPNSTIEAEVVVMGKLFGWAGTDFYRRDLSVGLLWGLPIALALGLVGAFVTTILSMLVAAAGVWFGGWADALVQRITEANMVLPVLAIGVMVFYFLGISLWVILGVVILLNVFGSTTKAYRAAFIQVKEAPYIEAAQAYGASSCRMILRYMVPRILPVLIPQLVTLIPAYVFLEATLGIFAVSDPFIPTWGSIIHDALKNWAFRANYYWITEPVALLLLTGLAFAMFGFSLDRILNPRLRDV
jgi:peptide/nickel transport system permease protein